MKNILSVKGIGQEQESLFQRIVVQCGFTADRDVVAVLNLQMWGFISKGSKLDEKLPVNPESNEAQECGVYT